MATLKFKNGVLTLREAVHAATLAIAEYQRAFVLPLARSYRDGWLKPPSTWSPTGSIFDAHKWTDQDFTDWIDKGNLELAVVWVNDHAHPFSFPGDPLIGDLQTTLVNYLERALLSQTKARKSGVWKTRDGEFKDRRILRFPWR